MGRHFAITALLFGAAACAPEVPRSVTDGWAAAAPLARVADTNADPRIVEVTLTAAEAEWTIAPGQTVAGYAYNGSVPGPVIETHVGDTLIVHFHNALPEPTTLHWHGVRVPANMDGGPHSQDPVAPGASFDYRFEVPDAGTFWYHPHVDEPVQMERGLYGALVVRGDDEPVVDTETVLVLDDLTLDASGEIAPQGDLLELHGGREGPTQLVNGVVTPTISVRSGERQRWRIVNAGSARIYRLALPGHAFTVLGSDGGAWTSPVSMPELLMAPGDRMDVLVDVAAAPGAPVTLTAMPYDRGHAQGVFVPIEVLHLSPTTDAALPTLPAIERTRAIAPIDVTGITPRQVTFDEHLDPTAMTITFYVNGETYPDVTPLASRVGATEVWDLVNMSEMSHPFHLHGFFFQILERDGVPVTVPTWEDTFELRGMETVRVAFVVDDRPGMWMFHCHILEHAHLGMMGMVEVAP